MSSHSRHLLTMLVSGLALSLAATAGDGCAGTGDPPIEIDLEIRGSESTFVTRSGWEVRLEVARLELEAIYAFGAALANDQRRALETPWLGPAVARAHSGHGPVNDGRLRAEWIETRVLDLADPSPARLGPIVGRAGALENLTVSLGAGTRGATAEVVGRAEREGVAFDFTGSLTLPADERERRVEDIGAAGALEPGATLVLEVDVAAWLDEVDFESLDGEASLQIPPSGQAHRAWLLGLRSPSTFDGRVEPPIGE